MFTWYFCSVNQIFFVEKSYCKQTSLFQLSHSSLIDCKPLISLLMVKINPKYNIAINHKMPVDYKNGRSFR